ncbi:MAG TPA: hypothetical protein VNV41_09130 [Candidatus Acidoferrales bacterium]|jgi:hypothetical protein|nr:hypothetical protein [Candidatus Acidoferrales bacterium]
MLSSMNTFIIVHVVLSLIGILTGFIVALGMLSAKRLEGITAPFLVTTVATSVTGFFFPFHGVTLGIVIGDISLVLLAIAILSCSFTRTFRHCRHSIPRSPERQSRSRNSPFWCCSSS